VSEQINNQPAVLADLCTDLVAAQLWRPLYHWSPRHDRPIASTQIVPLSVVVVRFRQRGEGGRRRAGSADWSRVLLIGEGGLRRQDGVNQVAVVVLLLQGLEGWQRVRGCVGRLLLMVVVHRRSVLQVGVMHRVRQMVR
jgi:hypothetical protein